LPFSNHCEPFVDRNADLLIIEAYAEALRCFIALVAAIGNLPSVFFISKFLCVS
jgi:hypothetical protein